MEIINDHMKLILFSKALLDPEKPVENQYRIFIQNETILI